MDRKPRTPILRNATDKSSSSTHLGPKMFEASATLTTEPQTLSPGLDTVPGAGDEPNGHGPRTHIQQHRASLTKRLMGRPPSLPTGNSIHSRGSQSSFSGASKGPGSSEGADISFLEESQSIPQEQLQLYDTLVSDVSQWLLEERIRRGLTHSGRQLQIDMGPQMEQSQSNGGCDPFSATNSHPDSEEYALEKLNQILQKNLRLREEYNFSSSSEIHKHPQSRRRPSSIKKLSKRYSSLASSDTEYADGDVMVPSCEAVLDNTKTLSYTGGAADSDADMGNVTHRINKEKEAWASFKFEILRLAHTLRLKGWRRVPLDRYCDIEVERISGALTNAIYVVSPPKELPISQANSAEGAIVHFKKHPPKLLLRIYGPQVEHLIDRESELSILRRFSKKKIGPRLLGTFNNGRFEEYFHARPLTPRDLRNPETSKQIAKRMRELHEGVELLEEERTAGPFVLRNWDKWVERCEQIISWLDGKISSGTEGPVTTRLDAWKKRGLVCGMEWRYFRRTFDRYREWLYKHYEGSEGVNSHLVFAHNDTQYGNILRLEPPGESPLLLPANEHKQLIVIDFEYASANVPGFEFANHFTEWCYNYHDQERPYSINAAGYPTLEEQKRFINSYVKHRPQFHPAASATPSLTASRGPSSITSTFTLDSRAPASQIQEEEARQDRAHEEETAGLMHETRLWRPACSAQWVAWGIVQAKIAGLTDVDISGCETEKAESSSRHLGDLGSDPLGPEAMAMAGYARDKRPEEAEVGLDPSDEEDEFDYLGYAHERAMFFWGDMVNLGLVRKEDLPADVLEKVKFVPF